MNPGLLNLKLISRVVSKNFLPRVFISRDGEKLPEIEIYQGRDLLVIMIGGHLSMEEIKTWQIGEEIMKYIKQYSENSEVILIGGVENENFEDEIIRIEIKKDEFSSNFSFPEDRGIYLAGLKGALYTLLRTNEIDFTLLLIPIRITPAGVSIQKKKEVIRIFSEIFKENEETIKSALNSISMTVGETHYFR